MLFFLFFSFIYALCKHPIPDPSFELEKYMGHWYEIAATWPIRHTFEKHLICTQAHYSLLSNQSVLINNTAFKPFDDVSSKGKWVSITGVGTPVAPATLSIQFTTNKAPYVVSAVFGHYEQALVASTCSAFIWILSRTPTLSDQKYTEIITKARELGYHTRFWRLKKSIQDHCIKIFNDDPPIEEHDTGDEDKKQFY
jgi:apolipoprotein D and lipocalin family protein